MRNVTLPGRSKKDEHKICISDLNSSHDEIYNTTIIDIIKYHYIIYLKERAREKPNLSYCRWKNE